MFKFLVELVHPIPPVDALFCLGGLPPGLLLKPSLKYLSFKSDISQRITPSIDTQDVSYCCQTGTQQRYIPHNMPMKTQRPHKHMRYIGNKARGTQFMLCTTTMAGTGMKAATLSLQ